MTKVPRNQLKLLFADIIRGFSTLSFKDTLVYVKHLTLIDSAEVDIKFDYYLSKAKSKGVPTQEEKIEYLIKENLWSRDRDLDITQNNEALENLKLTKSKLFRQNEIDAVNRRIKELKEKNQKIINEKNQLIEYTAEHYASNRVNEYFLSSSLFKDLNQKEKFIQESEEEIDNDLLKNLMLRYNEIVGQFNEINLKRMSLTSFFLNAFCLCDNNPMVFWGKPIIHLTFFQMELFGHGRFFKHVLSEMKQKPTEEQLDDPDLLVESYDKSQSLQEQIKQGKKPDDIVGLTDEDRKSLGIQSSPIDINSILVQEAKRLGRGLNMQEIFAIKSKFKT